jgi:hypothetical protein
MNCVFTKRDGEEVLFTYENLKFFCEKNVNGVFLKPADEYSATQLDCEPGVIRGSISSIGLKTMQFEFCDNSTGYEAECLYTYQTSCMPWLVGMLYPGKSMM